MTDTRRIVIGAAACLAALAGTAFAQTRAAEQEGRIRFEGQATTDSTKPRQHVFVRQVNPGGDLQVEVRDGRTTALLNGQPVPEDRVRYDKDSGVLQVFDEHGNVVMSCTLGDARAFAIAGDGAIMNLVPQINIPKGDAFLLNPDGTVLSMRLQPEQIASPPPVMVGITMAEPGESIREHFNLAEGEGILIATVMDGTPAARAGLKPHDVIILIDGQKPATQDRLRELLRSRKPGDTLNLTVLQSGQKKEVAVVLAPYDAARLGASVMTVPATPAVPRAPFAPGAWFEHFGDADQVRELALKLRGHLGELGAEFTPEIRREVEELVKRLTDEGGQLRRRLNEEEFFRWDQRVAPPAQGGRFFVQPTQPAAPSAAPDPAMQDRMARLEDRLDRLERSIDRLVNALERDREHNR
ncbi:MAG: PDZ domain-containing protein [Phycisphaeraceae bacterium]|nr:PDZ domain-containing protein [Phycisphaeraceae bacterium]